MKKILLLFAVLVTAVSASAEDYILYTSTNEEVVEPNMSDVFGANIVSNTYEDGQGKIVFDGEVTEIGSSAFSECTNLKSITLPKSVTSIGYYAFGGCSGLTSITIPEEVTDFDMAAFFGCSSLEAFYGFYASEDHRCLIVDNELKFFAPAGVTTYSIPEYVTSIGDYAFYSCNGLTSITIPEGVTSIRYASFNNCYNLTSINIPDNLTYLGGSAFSGCSSLTNIKLPAGLRVIQDDLFSSCLSLSSINIPEGVSYIGRGAFSCCISLESVNLPENLYTLGDQAFSSCTRLKSITIPETVTSLGYSVFEGCTSLESFHGFFASEDNRCIIVDNVLKEFASAGLTSYAIPEGVTTIYRGAFSYCRKITSVTIPESVTSIKNGSFVGCTGLKELILHCTTPPSIDNDVLYGETLSTCVLKVPVQSINLYISPKNWSGFRNIAVDLEDGENYSVESEIKNIGVSYHRTFDKANWQALFVPFAMQYSDWSELGTVARLLGVENGGTLVWETIGEGGSTEAGKPYIFKSKEEYVGKEVSFSTANTTLVSKETVRSIEIVGYTLSGTYSTKTDMAAIKGYALRDGNFYCTANEEQTLKPYRIFLTVPDEAQTVRMRIDGEEATAIEGIELEPAATAGEAYSLQGMRVGEAYKGIVIVNGKKIIR